MIYFIGNREIKKVKIGYAKNIIRRLKSISAHSPVEVEILGFMKGDVNGEHAIHRHFKEFRLHKEWFELSSPIEKFIENIDNARPYKKETKTKNAIFHCIHCNERNYSWLCTVCEQKIIEECKSCHLEIKHNTIVIPIKYNMRKVISSNLNVNKDFVARECYSIKSDV